MWSTLVIPAIKKPRQENHRVQDTVNSRPDCATQAIPCPKQAKRETWHQRDETFGWVNQANFTFNFGVFRLKPTFAKEGSAGAHLPEGSMRSLQSGSLTRAGQLKWFTTQARVKVRLSESMGTVCSWPAHWFPLQFQQ